MRKKIVAGNWKMNLTVKEGLGVVNELVRLTVSTPNDVSVIIAPSFLHLLPFKELLKDSSISLAAQNCSTEESGAFTGEVSAFMLADAGIQYVIIGHSERRLYQRESNEELQRKVNLALKHGLTPIFCCGEPTEVRNNETQEAYVWEQLEGSLLPLSGEQITKVIIAYEPLWAIGTGVNATPEQAEQMHAFIRSELAKKYSESVAANISILYGGSVNSANAKTLFAQPNVDGGLVGGASLKVDEFFKIIQS